MNKRIIQLVIFLLIFSLTGIITLQYLWIRQAIIERSAEFDNNVNKALNQVASHLDKIDNLQILEKFSTKESITVISDDEEKFITISNDPADASEIIVSNNDGIKRMKIISKNLNMEKQQLDSLAKTMQFISNDVKIDIAIDSLTDNVQRIVSINTEHIIDSVMVELEGKLKVFEEKAQAIENTYNQVVMEVKYDEEEIDPRIDQVQIEERIESALLYYNIDLDFEYGVEKDDENHSEWLFSSENFETSEMDYVIQLFPDDIYLKPYHLFVQFRSKDSHIFESLGWLLFSSLMFTLVIIFTFTYTIVVILRQKKISEIKSDFINNMTHEFKTPIATISLAVDSITNPKIIHVPDQIKYFSNIIKKENLRMNNQVENILQMALIDRRELNLNLSTNDIHDMIQKAVEHTRLQVEKRNGTITYELNAMHHLCNVDTIHMTNVIYNLLDNANKYSPENPQISIETNNIHNHLKVSVSDKGVGIPKEELNKIFEKLYRISTGNIHNIKGFGLGLTYVKAIVLAHSGDIQVESIPGKGSTFHIFLPLAQTSS